MISGMSEEQEWAIRGIAEYLRFWPKSPPHDHRIWKSRLVALRVRKVRAPITPFFSSSSLPFFSHLAVIALILSLFSLLVNTMSWIPRFSFLVSLSCAHLHMHVYSCDDTSRYSVYHAIPSQLIPWSHYARGQRSSVFFASMQIVLSLGKAVDCMHQRKCPHLRPLAVGVLGTPLYLLPPICLPSYLLCFHWPRLLFDYCLAL